MRLAFALALLLALPAGATPILDLEVAPDGGRLNVDNDASALQAFSVATTGAIVRIDVFAIDDFATCAGSGCFLLLGADAGDLALAALPSLGGGVLDDWIEFTLSAPRTVTAGDTLFFDVEHDNFIVWGSGAYASGVAWSCGIDDCTAPLNPNPFDHSSDVPAGTLLALTESYAFRVWIEPSAVPEPAGLAFGAVAVALAAARRRRIGGRHEAQRAR